MEIFVLLMSPTPAKVLGSALPLSPRHVVTGLEGYGQSAAGQSRVFSLPPLSEEKKKKFPLEQWKFFLRLKVRLHKDFSFFF